MCKLVHRFKSTRPDSDGKSNNQYDTEIRKFQLAASRHRAEEDIPPDFCRVIPPLFIAAALSEFLSRITGRWGVNPHRQPLLRNRRKSSEEKLLNCAISLGGDARTSGAFLYFHSRESLRLPRFLHPASGGDICETSRRVVTAEDFSLALPSLPLLLGHLISEAEMKGSRGRARVVAR